MISIGVRAFQRNQSIEQGHIPAGLIGDNVQIKYFTDSWTDALFAFPIIVLAFLCSYNMVEVHGALQDPTRERVKSVIHVSITSCFTLFQAFGFAGYFYAYDACKGNIFLNFNPSDLLIIVGRLGMGLTLALGTPIVTLPCRGAMLSFIKQLREDRTESSSMTKQVGEAREVDSLIASGSNEDSYSSFVTKENGIEIDMEQQKETPSLPEEDLLNDSILIHVGSTMMIISMAFFVAVSVPGVAVVWSVLGSSLGMIIGFIIPSACYLKIREKKGIYRRTNFAAMVLLIFSITIAVICTGQTVIGLL